MPTTPTFPGVYIEEVPSGVRTITPVGTSTAAFVDRFQRGPLNRAVQILSPADFEREFGGLDTTSEASYAIQQFFLNGGSDAWVVRVGNFASPNPAASLVLSNGVNPAFQIRAARQLRGASVINPGRWGNALRVEVDYDTLVLPNASIDPDNLLTQGELFNLTISEVEVRDGRTVARQTEAFRNLTLRPNARTNALAVVNAGSRLVQLDRLGMLALPTPPFRPDATGTLGVVPPGAVPASGTTFEVTVDPDGSLGPKLPVTVTVTLTYPGTITTFAELRPHVEAAIRSGANDPLANDDVRPLLADAVVQFANKMYRVVLGRTGKSFDPRATVFFGLAGATSLGLPILVAAAGPQMRVPTNAGIDSGPLDAPAVIGNPLTKTGMFALEDVSLFNILCIPAAAGPDFPLNGTAMRAVYAAAEAYCEARRAFLIIDIRLGIANLDAMQNWLDENVNLRHRNAAVYFPRVQIPDPLDQNRLRSVGASGTLAGLYAQTDAARGVWKAPAGTDVKLRNVQDLDYVLTDRENGVLNPLAANCLRSFPIFGSVSWGARTLDGADAQSSEWKYIPVRRFALFLEESLFRGTKWVVFEPNDEPLWAQIRLNLGAFMQGLFRQGAFQGQTPREAYFVKCDKETTTQADINLGTVNILVGFAPLKPAEFVIIKIQQMAGQIPT